MSKNRDRILLSARDILAKQSFERVTIKEICAHAGVADSTFYYHFKTKEALLDCLRTSDAFPLNQELLNIVASPNLLEQVLSAVSMCVARAERSGILLTAQYYRRRLSVEKDNAGFQAVHQQEFETAKTLIGYAQQAGAIQNLCDPETLAQAAILMASGVIVDWCAQDGAYNLSQTVRALLLTLLKPRPAEG